MRPRCAAEVVRAEAALRESEERYRALFDTTLSGMVLHEVICDAGGAPVDFRILDANPAFESLTGLRRIDTIGKAVREMRPAVDPGLIERYCRVALTGKPEYFEGVFETQGRSYEAVAFSPRHGQFAVSFSDVTARKQAEAEQRRLTRALRILSQCNQALVRAGSQEALLAEVCRIIVQDGGYRLAWVALAGDDAPELRVVAQAGLAAGAVPVDDEGAALPVLQRRLGAGSPRQR